MMAYRYRPEDWLKPERVEHVLSHCEEIRRLLEQTRPAETEIEHE
jgi:hypothetical protein